MYSNIEFKTLYNAINKEIPGKKLDDFITNEQSSAEFIENMIHTEFKVNEKVAQKRARHSILTYFMGKIFKPLFIDIIEENKTLNDLKFEELWIYISLYHDIGYTSSHIRNEKIDIDNLKGDLKRNPFQETYESGEDSLSSLNAFGKKYKSAFAYTYEEIKQYFAYSKKYHEKEGNKNEKNDHGILGGIISFNKMITNKNPDNLEKIKYISLIIAQHNIFKSSDKKSDECYREYKLHKLCSDSEFKIDKKTPLLLILSLVDTIECVKKFSKSENDNKYFETLTVLKNVKFHIDAENRKLTWDLSNLNKKCEAKEGLHDVYQKYINGIKNINHWTVYEVEDDSNILKIFY